MEASLRVDHPVAVKASLAMLLSGKALPLFAAGADPSLLLPPRWVWRALVPVLDDSKLYRDLTSADPVGSQVRSFIEAYLTSSGLPPRRRQELVRYLAAAVSGAPVKTCDRSASSCGGGRGIGDDDDDADDIATHGRAENSVVAMSCHAASLHLLAAFGAAAAEPAPADLAAARDASGAYLGVRAALTFGGAPAAGEAAVGGRVAAVGPELLEALTDRSLGADRFGCLNGPMRDLVLRNVVGLVALAADGPSLAKDRRVMAKFLAALPRPTLRFPTPTTPAVSRAVSRAGPPALSAPEAAPAAPPEVVACQAPLLADWAASVLLLPPASAGSPACHGSGGHGSGGAHFRALGGEDGDGASQTGLARLVVIPTHLFSTSMSNGV